MAPGFKTLAFGLAMGFCGTAYAQSPCYPMQKIEEMAAKYGESPTSYGKMANGGTLVIWASKDGKTWTAVVITPDGKAGCIIGIDGTDWVPSDKGV